MRSILVSGLLAVVSLPTWAADSNTNPTNVSPDEIVRKFAAKEAEAISAPIPD